MAPINLQRYSSLIWKDYFCKNDLVHVVWTLTQEYHEKLSHIIKPFNITKLIQCNNKKLICVHYVVDEITTFISCIDNLFGYATRPRKERSRIFWPKNVTQNLIRSFKTVIKSTTRFIVASMCIFYAPSLDQVSSFPELEHLESEVRPVASPPTLLRRQNFAGKATSHTWCKYLTK